MRAASFWIPRADPLSAAFAEAGHDAGYPATEDYNGARQEGFGCWQATIRNGRRCSAAVAYLRPALGRAGLTVETWLLFVPSLAVIVVYAARDPARFVGRAPQQVLQFVEGVVEPIRRRYAGVLGQTVELKV